MSVVARRDPDGMKVEQVAASTIVCGVFRANPRYELVLLDRLSAAERELLGGLQVEDLYGVLRARNGEGLESRSVTAETALLFHSLGEPGPLPTYVQARLGHDLERTVARLVLDDVLELEHDGRFVCGSAAAACVLAGRSRGGHGRIGELSLTALRYGQELATALPGHALALRLYGYGRRPFTPALAAKLPDAAALDAFLGLQPGGLTRAALDTGWLETTSAAAGGDRVYWRSWRARGARDESSAAYKLYVSPALDALPQAVEAVASSLAGSRGVQAFKFGAELRDLCRADKLVVYFGRLDDLQDAAATLEQRLHACPAQGVPFTAAVTGDGLLSWGVDPPALAGDGGEPTSWRLWVSERLAEYLAAGATSTLEPWRFALERLRLAGIDTDTWVPASGMWREALSSA